MACASLGVEGREVRCLLFFFSSSLFAVAAASRSGRTVMKDVRAARASRVVSRAPRYGAVDIAAADEAKRLVN
jgi:hypothetical protein